ncbi:hypothetical protein [Leptospira brenneri]|uniref:Sulfotransferase domain-containing protein n=1 Tax=Leptospira brenneri TaxID=2023182 RepID=A0A2M9Y2A1_9LEPT|nr:hypothetical protein [Leptospira brenneri]PJZ45516.1 hypothetical protein CH361_10855 [Leptospira brenneri]TGK92008.1 hypothetical protein EHQ30_17665 [Leptospira brenneri]
MKLEKRNTFSNDIIFIDGLWGTGKSLLGPIVSGMAGVEKVKVESLYEYVSWLFHLKKIDLDGALWMLRTYADCSQYHNVIGRETNLRWSDDTGLKNSHDKLKIIFRLFLGEGDSKVAEINKENLAFCAMSHMLMLSPDLLSLAYGSRVKIIEVVRHPLYMVNHFASYLERFESPREFTMSFYVNDIKVPWFVKGWEKEYLTANLTERAVLCITRTYPWLLKNIEKVKNLGLQVLDLSFEEIVFNTDATLNKLKSFTDRDHSRRIKSILNRQSLPRESISDGKGHAGYGWKKDRRPESEMYSDLVELVQKNCSPSVFRELNKTIKLYNNRYPSKLAEFV